MHGKTGSASIRFDFRHPFCEGREIPEKQVQSFLAEDNAVKGMTALFTGRGGAERDLRAIPRDAEGHLEWDFPRKTYMNGGPFPLIRRETFCRECFPKSITRYLVRKYIYHYLLVRTMLHPEFPWGGVTASHEGQKMNSK